MELGCVKEFNHCFKYTYNSYLTFLMQKSINNIFQSYRCFLEYILMIIKYLQVITTHSMIYFITQILYSNRHLTSSFLKLKPYYFISSSAFLSPSFETTTFLVICNQERITVNVVTTKKKRIMYST